MERKFYVLMFTADNGRAMFTTSSRKDIALRHAKRIQATVYAVPTYPVTYGWDCPTIRAIFDPIYIPSS